MITPLPHGQGHGGPHGFDPAIATQQQMLNLFEALDNKTETYVMNYEIKKLALRLRLRPCSRKLKAKHFEPRDDPVPTI